MLSPSQADSMADELLAQARKDAEKRINAIPSFVPPVYWCKELKPLSPLARTRIVRAAAKEAGNDWRVVVIAAGCFAYSIFNFFGTEHFIPAAWLVIAGAVLPILNIHRGRQRVKELARAMHERNDK